MLSNVSWGDYLFGAAILAFVYYVVIVAVFYRSDLIKLFRRKFNPSPAFSPNEAEDWETGNEEDGSFQELEATVADIRQNILTVAGKETSKAGLLTELKARLANYDGLRVPAYRAAINNYIAEHAKNLNGVAFSEEELDAAWGVPPR